MLHAACGAGQRGARGVQSPVEGLTVMPAVLPAQGDRGAARTRSSPRWTAARSALLPVDRLGDGELRFVALALVLLTGPGVLDVDTSTEVLPAARC